MDKLEIVQLAESTKSYIINFLTTFDKQILQLGPDEAFTEFLCQYGNTWSEFIMVKIRMTDVFSKEEYIILDKIERYLYKLMSDHPKGEPWNMIEKENYLEIKSLIYDYLVLVNDLKYF
jgi:hypothetical protein